MHKAPSRRTREGNGHCASPHHSGVPFRTSVDTACDRHKRPDALHVVEHRASCSTYGYGCGWVWLTAASCVADSNRSDTGTNRTGIHREASTHSCAVGMFCFGTSKQADGTDVCAEKVSNFRLQSSRRRKTCCGQRMLGSSYQRLFSGHGNNTVTCSESTTVVGGRHAPTSVHRWAAAGQPCGSRRGHNTASPASHTSVPGHTTHGSPLR